MVGMGLDGTLRSPLRTLAQEVDRLLGSQLDWTPPGSGAAPWPAVNLWRQGEAILAEAELPGLGPDDVRVHADEATLTIAGAEPAGRPEGAQPIRVERPACRFERTIGLPAEIDPKGVSASMREGVLRVTMPLAESARPRRIEVRVGDAPSGACRDGGGGGGCA